jgi:hypothetical protein
MEIEMFFAKYDDDGDGIFNIKEESLMMSDLNTDRVDAGVNINFFYKFFPEIRTRDPFLSLPSFLYTLKKG